MSPNQLAHHNTSHRNGKRLCWRLIHREQKKVSFILKYDSALNPGYIVSIFKLYSVEPKFDKGAFL
jgi:hypothetical protein